jgi:hypothetical protein
MKRKTVNFKSKAGYDRWLAYGHMHNVFNGPGETIHIRGKLHRVKHEK